VEGNGLSRVSGIIFPRILATSPFPLEHRAPISGNIEEPLGWAGSGQYHEALSQNVQIFIPTIAIQAQGFSQCRRQMSATHLTSIGKWTGSAAQLVYRLLKLFALP